MSQRAGAARAFPPQSEPWTGNNNRCTFFFSRFRFVVLQSARPFSSDEPFGHNLAVHVRAHVSPQTYMNARPPARLCRARLSSLMIRSMRNSRRALPLLAALAAASHASTTDESCLQFSCATVGDGRISCDALWSDVCAHGTGALKVRAVCPHDCVAPGDEAEWRSLQRLLFADAPSSSFASTRAVRSNGAMAEAHGERTAPDGASANAAQHRAPGNMGAGADSRLADKTLRSTADLAQRAIAMGAHDSWVFFTEANVCAFAALGSIGCVLSPRSLDHSGLPIMSSSLPFPDLGSARFIACLNAISAFCRRPSVQ